MALSFRSVEKAYEVFHELGVKHVPSWPEDMYTWSEEKRAHPEEDRVYGWDKKVDDGWENIFFFVRNPSQELKDKFDQLKHRVPNSSMSKPYGYNKELWMFGWF